MSCVGTSREQYKAGPTLFLLLAVIIGVAQATPAQDAPATDDLKQLEQQRTDGYAEQLENHLRRHYEKLGIANRIELDLHEGGHEARTESGVAFLTRWLKDEKL